MFLFIALLVLVGIIAVAGFFGFKQVRKIQDNMNVMFHRQTQSCTMADVDQEVEKRVRSEVNKAMTLERRRLQEMQETYVDMIETLRAGERGVPTGCPFASKKGSVQCPFKQEGGAGRGGGGGDCLKTQLPFTKPPVTKRTRKVLEARENDREDEEDATSMPSTTAHVTAASSSSSSSSSSASNSKKKKKRRKREKKEKRRKKRKASDAEMSEVGQSTAEFVQSTAKAEEPHSEVEAPELSSRPQSPEKQALEQPPEKKARPASGVSDIDDVIVETMSDVSISELIAAASTTV